MPSSHTRRRPEQDRSRERIERVLTAARDLFAEAGLEPVSFSDIARRADVALPALYRYFPNKQAVIRELAVRALDEDTMNIVEPLLASGAPVDEMIRMGIEAYVDLHLAEPYRRSIRHAIRADPELAALDNADTRRNALALAVHVSRVTGREADDIAVDLELCIGLLDSVVELAFHREGDHADIVDRFATTVTSAVL